MADPALGADPLLSVVVPVFNEGVNIGPLLARAIPVLGSLGERWEIVLVDDGSTDDTPQKLTRLSRDDPRIRWVQLARNFGHQAALVAGLTFARGAVLVTMDGDLQHPPELLPQLVAHWRGGADIVQAIRRAPADASVIKRAGSRGFYRLLSLISHARVTPGAADFRLMSREAVRAFLACGERCRFNRGLVQWIGFAVREVPYDAQARLAGRSKYSYRAMLRLAGDAIFSFSWWPLRVAGLAGAFVSLVAAGYLVFVLWAKLFTSYTVSGWSSILAAVLVLGGVNLIVLWILGEYVGRLYEEAKQRPIFIVRAPRAEPAPTAPTTAPADERHDASPPA